MKKTKLRGNTLPEVLVALLVLSCVMVITFQVLGLSRGGNTFELKQEAIIRMNAMINMNTVDSVFRDSVQYSRLQIRVEQRLHGIPMLKLRRVECVDPNGMILCFREIVK